MWIINALTLNKALKNGGDNAYLIQDYNPIFMDESASHWFILIHDKDFDVNAAIGVIRRPTLRISVRADICGWSMDQLSMVIQCEVYLYLRYYLLLNV